MNTIGSELANYWIDAGNKFAQKTLNESETKQLHTKTLQSIEKIKYLPNDQITLIYEDFLKQISAADAQQRENLSHELASNVSLGNQKKEGSYFVFAQLITFLQSRGFSKSSSERIDVLKQIITNAFKEAMSLNQAVFPQEILHEIFMRTPSIPPVNKYWDYMNKVKIINSTGEIQKAGFTTWEQFFKETEGLMEHKDGNPALNVAYLNFNTPVILSALEYFLTGLNYSVPTFLKNEILKKAVKIFPNLIKIDLDKNIFDDQLSDLKGLEHLEYLDMSRCSKISDQGLEFIAPLKKLKYLNLSHNKQISSQGLKYLSSLKLIESLGLAGVQIKDEGVKFLVAELENLKTLDLAFNGITEEGLKQIGNLKNLENLNLVGLFISDAGFKEVAKLTKLHELVISNISDEGINQLSPLSKLKRIAIFSRHTDNTSLTDLGLENLTRLFPNLEELSIRMCTNITNEGLQHLKNLKKLKKLYLSMNARLTDEGLTHLTKIKALEFLDISQTNITLSGLMKELPKLTNVKILSCFAREESWGMNWGMDIRQLSDKFPNLKVCHWKEGFKLFFLNFQSFHSEFMAFH